MNNKKDRKLSIETGFSDRFLVRIRSISVVSNPCPPATCADVERAADHVAGLSVGQHLRPLSGGSVEALYPLHQAQGLGPLHSVSGKTVALGSSSKICVEPCFFC